MYQLYFMSNYKPFAVDFLRESAAILLIERYAKIPWPKSNVFHDRVDALDWAINILKRTNMMPLTVATTNYDIKQKNHVAYNVLAVEQMAVYKGTIMPADGHYLVETGISPYGMRFFYGQPTKYSHRYSLPSFPIGGCFHSAKDAELWADALFAYYKDYAETLQERVLAVVNVKNYVTTVVKEFAFSTPGASGSPTQSRPSDTKDCPDCKGTGKYVGLTVTRPCPTCTK